MRDEGCLQPGGRRPKTLSLGWRGGGKTGWGIGGKSKGCTLPMTGDLCEEVLFGLAEGLLKQVDDWPCGNLSLSVGAFEKTESGKGIMEFLIRGGVAKDLRDEKAPREKQKGFLGKGGEGMWKDSSMDGGRKYDSALTTEMHQEDCQEHDLDEGFSDSDSPGHENCYIGAPIHENIQNVKAPLTQHCAKCNIPIPVSEVPEHQDWHFAKDLAEEEKRNAKVVAIPQPVAVLPTRGKRKASQMGTVEKGQSKLKFKK